MQKAIEYSQEQEKKRRSKLDEVDGKIQKIEGNKERKEQEAAAQAASLE